MTSSGVGGGWTNPLEAPLGNTSSKALVTYKIHRLGKKTMVSGLRAALKAVYLAGESPAPGLAYLPG